ncbi:toll-like receptor 7 isoform X2 [Cylas formicarius]|nr:toll-like receptor 7 isoform X2 [Cylas formicarius]
MVSVELHCTGLESTTISEEIIARVTKTTVSSLNITDSFLPAISQSAFDGFQGVGSIHITSSHVSQIENATFEEFDSLTSLNLSDNFLRDFNVDAFPAKNALLSLDLSNNVLRDFSNFNVSRFPRISVLNLENNLLDRLPLSILDKLQVENEFFLLVDNNPWNCEHEDWVDYLNENMTKAFCGNTKTYIPKLRIERQQNEATQTNESQAEDEFKPDRGNKPNCAKCSFYFCILWLVGGVWLGIIVGNVGKIKNLLCGRGRSQRSSNAAVQCDHCQMEFRHLHPPSPASSRKNVGEKS